MCHDCANRAALGASGVAFAWDSTWVSKLWSLGVPCNKNLGTPLVDAVCGVDMDPKPRIWLENVAKKQLIACSGPSSSVFNYATSVLRLPDAQNWRKNSQDDSPPICGPTLYVMNVRIRDANTMLRKTRACSMANCLLFLVALLELLGPQSWR